MKHIYFLVLAILCTSTTIAQETWNVEAGGAPDTATLPYFDPQFLTIDEGDIVIWTNVDGFHSINGSQGTFPDNPASFSHPSQSAPWTFEHTFTVPGVYDYECSVGSHNETQFGTITVLPADNIEYQASEVDVVIAPMPFHVSTTVTIPESWGTTYVKLFGMNGAVVQEYQMSTNQLILQRGELSNGIYFLQLTSDNNVVTRKVIIRNGK